ncbi:fungal hydrophobin domain-containing protein [Trichoderma breve]|uniref:Fungal hydrophobin domain-containing protein n=2 Tax=Trichoderma TaxID=5543 RepID=A0A9W9EE85_9HYPO|nr:fungal hydrophobin domain-containing protein [Trichoderma breve]KAJ4865090.1 fungal hydrophobin domain-containing protein [Trichoderma breve]
MKFFAAAALFATSAMAAVCPTGLYSNPLCCSDNVLGLIGIDCSTPTVSLGDNAALFQANCASKGKQPLCCVAPAADQGILCQKPAGTL